MNPDEIIWRLEEDAQLLQECEEAHADGACELIKARMDALKHGICDLTIQVPKRQEPEPLERVRRARPSEPGQPSA